MKSFLWMAVIILLLLPSICLGQTAKDLVPKYKQHLIPDYPISKEEAFQKARYHFKKSNGHLWLQAIWYVESSQMDSDFKIIIGDDGMSYGPFQYRVPTIRWMDRVYDDIDLAEYSDADIAYKLLFDFEFSVNMCARYLGYLERRFGFWPYAVEGYNRGPNGVKAGQRLGLPYYKRVLRAYKNTKHGL